MNQVKVLTTILFLFSFLTPNLSSPFSLFPSFWRSTLPSNNAEWKRAGIFGDINPISHQRLSLKRAGINPFSQVMKGLEKAGINSFSHMKNGLKRAGINPFLHMKNGLERAGINPFLHMKNGLKRAEIKSDTNPLFQLRNGLEGITYSLGKGVKSLLNAGSILGQRMLGLSSGLMGRPMIPNYGFGRPRPPQTFYEVENDASSYQEGTTHDIKQTEPTKEVYHLNQQQINSLPSDPGEESYGSPIEHVEESYGSPAGAVQQTYGSPIQAAEEPYGSPAQSLEETYGSPIGSVEESFVHPIQSLEEAYGSPAGSVKEVYESPIGTQGESYGFPVQSIEESSEKDSYGSPLGSAQDSYEPTSIHVSYGSAQPSVAPSSTDNSQHSDSYGLPLSPALGTQSLSPQHQDAFNSAGPSSNPIPQTLETTITFLPQASSTAIQEATPTVSSQIQDSISGPAQGISSPTTNNLGQSSKPGEDAGLSAPTTSNLAHAVVLGAESVIQGASAQVPDQDNPSKYEQHDQEKVRSSLKNTLYYIDLAPLKKNINEKHGGKVRQHLKKLFF